jgi:WD40 repeat protein
VKTLERTALLALAAGFTALWSHGIVAQDQVSPIPMADIKHDGPVDFQKEILPILRKNCLSCHSASVAKASLVLESPKTILEGGKSGPAAVPGKSDESLILKAAAHREKPFMPPLNNKVSAVALEPAELGLIKLWIDQGAKGTVTASAAVKWHPLPPGVNPIYAAALSPEGQIAACGRANQVFIYQVPTGELLTRLTDPALLKSGLYKDPGVADLDNIQALAFHPQGDLLASSGYRTVKLWRLPQNVRQQTLAGSEEPLFQIAVSPDGAWLAAGGEEGTLRVWNLKSGKERIVLPSHSAQVSSLLFSADGSRLFSASLDKSIRALNVKDGSSAGRIESPAPVLALALVAKETQIAAGCADNVIRIWPLAALSPPQAAAPAPPLTLAGTLAGHSGPVTALAGIPQNDSQLLSGSADGTVRQWNLADGKQARQLEHGGPVTSIAVRPDGQRLASAGTNNVVKLWSFQDTKALQEMKGDFRARNLVLRLTSKTNAAKERSAALKNVLAQAEKDAQSKLDAAQKAAAKLAEAEKAAAEKGAEAKAAAEKKAAEAPEKAKAAAEAETARKSAERGSADAALEAKSAAEGAARAKLSSATAEGELKKVEAGLDGAQKALAASEQPVRAVAFSGNNLELASAGDDQTIHTWSAESGSPIDTFKGHGGAVLSVAFLAGKSLVSGSADKTARVWSLGPEWTLERTLGGEEGPVTFADRVTALAFSADGQLLAAGGGEPSRSGELKVLKVNDGSVLWSLPDAHSDSIFALEFSPDGKYLASGAADKFIKIFEVATGKLTRSLEGHTHHVLGLSWKPDGTLLASSGADNVIKIWNLETSEQRRTIEGFQKQVTAVHFLGDSQEIVSCSGDASVRVHRVDNGQNARSLAGGTDYLYTVAVTPDGQLVAAGGHASVLLLWDAATGKLLQTFKN